MFTADKTTWKVRLEFAAEWVDHRGIYGEQVT
jgi:hypothetical protein